MALHAALRWLTLQLRGAHCQRPTGQHCGQTLGTHALGHAANKQGLCSLCHLPEPRADALLRSCALGAGVETPTLREIFIVAVAQLAARRSHNPKVVSSIPTCHSDVDLEQSVMMHPDSTACGSPLAHSAAKGCTLPKANGAPLQADLGHPCAGACCE